MEKVILNLPALFGDHHVTNVRSILFALPGVEDVNASSSFRIVEVTFDPAAVSENTIIDTLAEAGYAEEPTVPVETTLPADGDTQVNRFFRHTAAYAQVGHAVSFAQTVSYAGRPLWPCPGMGVINAERYEVDIGDG
ncbi:MAG: heavy-metal-associated domain-containing protein [Chloroflexi bacterium]|nr:heavy-metal-associated domain-containing protein [Chloroflexota bacterium]